MNLRNLIEKEQSQAVSRRRGYYVVKSNDFIYNARFNLNLLEQKIVLFMISKLKPEHESFHEYNIKINEYLSVFGMSDAGKNYANIKRTLKSLSDKSFWLKDLDNNEKLLRFFNTVHIDTLSSSIRLTFHEDMRPYLLQLKRNYTKYCLEWILPFKSKYSIPLYEFLKMNSFRKRLLSINISELKELLNYDNKSGDFNNFKQRVLIPCVDEINMYTDLDVEWEALKDGKKYSIIYFSFKPNDMYDTYINQLSYFNKSHQKVRTRQSKSTKNSII